MHEIIMGCVAEVQDELASFSGLNGTKSESGFSSEGLMEDSPLRAPSASIRCEAEIEVPAIANMKDI